MHHIVCKYIVTFVMLSNYTITDAIYIKASSSSSPESSMDGAGSLSIARSDVGSVLVMYFCRNNHLVT